MNTLKIRTMAEIALMAAVMCILGPMSIPIGIIPVSLTPLTVFLAVYILGTGKGTISCLIYLAIGLVGLPVLSGYTGGPGKLFGPTGGYLFGFLPMAIIAGFFIHHFYHNILVQFAGMLLGLMVCYAFGTLWLAFSAKMTLGAALAAGVTPFILFDISKIVISILLGRIVRARLVRAGILEIQGAHV